MSERLHVRRDVGAGAGLGMPGFAGQDDGFDHVEKTWTQSVADSSHSWNAAWSICHWAGGRPTVAGESPDAEPGN